MRIRRYFRGRLSVDVYRAVESGMIASIGTDSAELQAINDDGVVEEAGALTAFPTTTTLGATDLDHIQLECDPGVIGFVGGQVHP